jgi:hypothetical protein
VLELLLDEGFRLCMTGAADPSWADRHKFAGIRQRPCAVEVRLRWRNSRQKKNGNDREN